MGYIKYLGLSLIMLLGLYPIVELTRVIIVSGTYYFPDMDAQFIAEVIIMWILYLSIVPVFLLLNKHMMNNENLMKKEVIKPGKNKIRYPIMPIKDKDYIRVDYNK